MLETIRFPIDLTNSNDGRGGSFWQSAKRRKEYEATIGLCGVRRTPFDIPVTISVCRVLGPRQRLWDADSVLRGSAKELIDAMVACGWFHDDGPKWITAAVGIQDTSRRSEGPAVEITIKPTEVK